MEFKQSGFGDVHSNDSRMENMVREARVEAVMEERSANHSSMR